MSGIFGFPLTCLIHFIASRLQDAETKRISDAAKSSAAPLPSPREGAPFADITAPSTTIPEFFSTMDPTLYIPEISSPPSTTTFPSWLMTLIFFLLLISGLLFFRRVHVTGANRHGEYLLDAAIDDQEHGQQAAREALLDIDQAENKHQLDHLKLTVDSLKKAESKAKNSEADAKAAAEKARNDLLSVQARFDHLKAELDASTAECDKAHSRVSEMTGKNEKLVEAQQALQKEMDSRRDEFDAERQELTRKAGEAAQASEAELASVKTENAELTNKNAALKKDLHDVGRMKWVATEHLDRARELAESQQKGFEEKLKRQQSNAQTEQKLLQKQLDGMEWNLGREQSTNEELREELLSAQNQLNSSQSQLAKAQGSIEVLEQQSNADRVKLEDAQSVHQNLQEKLKLAQEGLDSVQKESSVLQDTNERLELEIADLQKQAIDAKTKALGVEEQLENDYWKVYKQFMDAENERDSAHKKLEELRSSAQLDKEKLNLSQNEVEQLKKKLEDSEKLRKADEDELEKVRYELSAARETIENAGDTSEVAQKYSSLKKKYKDLKGKLETEENASHQLRNELSRDRAILEVERQRADKLDAEKSGFLTKQHSSAETLLQKDRDLTSSQKSVNKLRGELEDARNAKSPAESGWFKASRRVKELEAENAKLRDDSKMQRALDEKEEALQKANGAVQQHQEALAHRNTKISDLRKELEQAKQQAMSPSQLRQYCEQAQQEAIDKEHKNGLYHYGKLERAHKAKLAELAELAEAAAEQQSALDGATFTSEHIAKELRTLCLILKYSKLWLDRWRNGRPNTNQDDAGDDDQKPEDDRGDQDGHDGDDDQKPDEDEGDQGGHDDDESKKSDGNDAGVPDSQAKNDGEYGDSQPDGGEDQDAPGELDDEYDYYRTHVEDVESVDATDNTVEPTITPKEATTGTNGPTSPTASLPTLADNDTATDSDERIIPKWFYGNTRGGRGNVIEQKKGQKKRRKHNDVTQSSILNAAADMDPSAAVSTSESTNTLTQASQQALGQSSSVSSPSTSSAFSMPRQAQNLSFRSTHADTRETPRQIQYHAPHQLQYQAPQQLQYQAPYQPQHWAPPQLPFQSPHPPQYQTYHQAQYQAPSQPQYRSPNHTSTSIQPPRQPYGFSGPSNWASQSRYSNSHPAQRRRF